ncbi:hypothetical protein ACRALDRAFT_2099707 [Sodiomyces alcalophilus JCM 7366]|uniref:uncharacterized protein n=1 Tax=Sodiomyces alcalophilus JCM 7366 TaxID=591952 RepID=UPI0039B6C338
MPLAADDHDSDRRSAPSSPTSPDPPVPWARRPASLSSRRLSSTRYTRTARIPALTRLHRTAAKAYHNLRAAYLRLTPLQRAGVIAAVVSLNVLAILFLVYSHAIFTWLGPISHQWRALPGGWLIIWVLVVISAFPPLIGYSTCITIAGFVYGFPLGYPIVATANVAGSLAAFCASRTIFSDYVHRLVGRDHRFIALGQVLRKDGLGILVAVRLCPLPYSISNGFLATVPSIHPLAFAAATALASPKLLVHVFIGSRLALIAEQGDKMSLADKAINWTSMILGGLLGAFIGWLIYHRTMTRAAEIALEENQAADLDDADNRDVAENSPAPRGHGDFDFADVEAGLVDPDDIAALMNEDDISLWGEDEGLEADERYHDNDENGSVDGHGNDNTNGLGKK